MHSFTLTQAEKDRIRYRARQAVKHGTAPAGILCGFEVAAEALKAPASGAEPSDIDLQTFNYGRALGKPRDATLAAQYTFLAENARIFADLAQQFSKLAWSQEMALQDVRTCETEAAQAEAMARAAKIWEAADSVPAVEAKAGLHTVRFHRYGRAFMSGRRV